MDPDALLADLDADQRRAVTTDSRLVAVIAGAGSGKTRVLTRRVAYRVATETAEVGHTLVLTFTREAAGELRRRLRHLGLNERIAAGTFHAIAHGLLRQRWQDLDQRPRSIVNDRPRIVRGLAGSIDAAGLDALVGELNWATARGLGPDEYTAAARRGDRRATVAADRVAETLAAYRQEKRRRGIVDLDDLLALTMEALDQDADFAAATRWRFRHVLVDEAQDLNPLQHRLVDRIRHGHDDLFLVGDPAQSIYGFNGSDPAILIDVADRFPGIEVVRLPTNHRCTPQIVQVGAHALRSADQPADVVSNRPDGAPVKTVAHDDEQAESETVARAIARLDPTLVRSGKVAVLARTHAALNPARQTFESHGIAVRRSVEGPGSPLAPLLADGYRVKDSNQLRRWARDLIDVAALDEEPDGHDDPRAEVARVATEFLRDEPTGDGAAFRAWVNANDPFGRDLPGVELLTFHAAKGREWHTVHLVGAETSLVPHRSATTIAGRAEEARLLYVALTRATDDLTVNWSRRRSGYQRKPTPFLEGFDSTAPDLLPPPRELVSTTRSPRQDALARLRAWRAAAARAGGILPDAICSDRTLGLIADHRPASADELDALTGLGAITSQRLFARINAALAESA